MAMALAEPLAVVAILELEQGHAQLLDRVERPHPQLLLFQRADEPLGHALALRLPHKRRTGRDAEELQLILKVVTHVLATMIVPRLQARGDPLLVAPEDRPHTLPQGFHRFKARPRPGRMEADTLGGAMVDDDEDRRGPLAP